MHRATERETALRFCEFLPGAVPRKRVEDNSIDWDLLGPSGRVVAFFEVKNRNNSFRAYPTVVCDKSKMYYAAALHKATKKRVMFVARFTDCMAVLDMNVACWKDGRMTLRNPRDRYDVDDAVVEFALDQFRVL